MNDLAPPRAGLLETAMLKLFTRPAQVLEVEDIGSSFRLITLGGDALRNVVWSPGDKIQLQLGGWTQRTYTPMEWDAENGRTRILAYLHGGGPGARWAEAVRAGDSCMVFGPRKSVRLERSPLPLILFGDETALGLAAALSRQTAPQMLFEVSAHEDSMAVIDRLQLHHAKVCARVADDAHLGELEAHLSVLMQAHATVDLVLAGRAGAIQRINRSVRQQVTAIGQRQSKAYWAPGKTGLD